MNLPESPSNYFKCKQFYLKDDKVNKEICNIYLYKEKNI